MFKYVLIFKYSHWHLGLHWHLASLSSNIESNRPIGFTNDASVSSQWWRRDPIVEDDIDDGVIEESQESEPSMHPDKVLKEMLKVTVNDQMTTLERATTVPSHLRLKNGG